MDMKHLMDVVAMSESPSLRFVPSGVKGYERTTETEDAPGVSVEWLDDSLGLPFMAQWSHERMNVSFLVKRPCAVTIPDGTRIVTHAWRSYNVVRGGEECMDEIPVVGHVVPAKEPPRYSEPTLVLLSMEEIVHKVRIKVLKHLLGDKPAVEQQYKQWGITDNGYNPVQRGHVIPERRFVVDVSFAGYSKIPSYNEYAERRDKGRSLEGVWLLFMEAEKVFMGESPDAFHQVLEIEDALLASVQKIVFLQKAALLLNVTGKHVVTPEGTYEHDGKNIDYNITIKEA